MRRDPLQEEVAAYLNRTPEAASTGRFPVDTRAILRDVGYDVPGGGGGDHARFVRLSDVVERRIEWYWDQRCAAASVVLVAGDGGVGKSTLVQALAACMTRGARFPGGVGGDPRSVVILSAEEDTASIVRPRMRLMGADLGRVTVLDIDGAALTLPSGAARLEERCRAEGAGLLVIDTGPAFLDRGLKSNNEEDVRQFFAPLRAMAERLRMVVLVLAHLNKDVTRASGQRIMGGAAWRNVPRQVLLVGPPPGEDPRETGDRLVAVEKNNYGTYGTAAVAFRLQPAPEDPSRAVVAWRGEVPGISAADLVGAVATGDERSEREAAVEFLQAELASGPRPVKELEEAARGAGVGWATIKKAKGATGVVSRKDGFGGGWTWALEEAPTKGDAPESPFVGDGGVPLGENPHQDWDSGEAAPRRGTVSESVPLGRCGNCGKRTSRTEPGEPVCRCGPPEEDWRDLLPDGGTGGGS